MSLEQPQQQPATNDELTKVEETAAEERETTPELEQVSKFAQPFRDKAAAYAERANILFNENQKQVKAFNRKGWDKTSSLYQEWSATTKLVQTAEKLADYYQTNIGVENEIDKIMRASKDKSKTLTEGMKTGYSGIEKKEELVKGAKALHDKLTQLEEQIKSLKESSAADLETAAEHSARWEGVKTPKIGRMEEIVAEATEGSPTDAVAEAIERRARRKEETEQKQRIEAEEAEKKAAAEAKEKARQQKQLDAEWKKRQEAKASRKIVMDALEKERQANIAKAQLDRETTAYEKKVTKGPIAWLKRLFSEKAPLDAPFDATQGDKQDDITEEELTPAQIKAKRAEENKWWNKEKQDLTSKK